MLSEIASVDKAIAHLLDKRYQLFAMVGAEVADSGLTTDQAEHQLLRNILQEQMHSIPKENLEEVFNTGQWKVHAAKSSSKI